MESNYIHQSGQASCVSVFVSSVFKGLTQLRQDLVYLLREEFGFNVWWAEDYAYLWYSEPHKILQACMDGVESCDIFIGLYGQRYGSTSMGLSYSELELHHAVRCRKHCLLYRFPNIDNLPSLNNMQQFLLAVLADPQINSMPFHKVYSRVEFIRRVKSDLKKMIAQPVFQMPPDRIVEEWANVRNGAVTCELPINSASDLVGTLRGTVDIARTNPGSCARIAGRAFLGIAMLTEPKSESSLKLFDEALKLAYYSLAWGGDLFSQVRMTQTLMKLDQRLYSGRNLRRLAVQLASGYYAERDLKNCEKWLRLSDPNKPDPVILAPLLLLRGKSNDAAALFKGIVNETHNDGEKYALHLAYWGASNVLAGRVSHGLDLLESALQITDHATTQVRVQRMQARSLIQVGKSGAASVIIGEALELASEYSLNGQLIKLRLLRDSISNNIAK